MDGVRYQLAALLARVAPSTSATARVHAPAHAAPPGRPELGLTRQACTAGCAATKSCTLCLACAAPRWLEWPSYTATNWGQVGEQEGRGA